jgi:RimJ/RimL family protein N-acetyltransferase
MTADWATAAVADNFVIQTPRVLIRPLAAEDEQLYLDLYTNAETMAFVGEPLSPEKAIHSFQIAMRLNAKRPFQRLFLVIIVQQHAAGLCAINGWQSETAEVEVGIMLLRQWQGKGYAAEALGALIQRVQQQLQGAVVKGDLDPDNKAAARLVLQTGFQPDPKDLRTYWVRRARMLHPNETTISTND